MSRDSPGQLHQDARVLRLSDSHRHLLVCFTLLACDDAEVAPYVPPTPNFPSVDDDRAFLLSEVGLFDGDRVAPDLIAFTPRWALWSDGLLKRRWLRLPVGTTLDTSDPDHWVLPIGAILFKEFATPEGPLETRVIARTGPGSFDYWMGAFRWRDDGSDAEFVRSGATNVGGVDHDIPTAEQCWACHVGTPGRMLGLGAVQLSATVMDDLPVSEPLPELEVSGDGLDALGYLHANCSHCHSPIGVARPDTDIDLSLSIHDRELTETGVYRTAVGVATRSWIRPDYPLRVAPGDAARSALIARMGHRGDTDQMPPLATKRVDDDGLAIVKRWIADLD